MAARAAYGTGLRLLTGRVTSPSFATQLAALRRQYPEARWHQWEPLSRKSGTAGAVLAFGTAVDTLPLFQQAEVVLAIEGRDQVMQGRAMHWIRVDRYWGGEQVDPEILFQPVPCMHCEDAPCSVRLTRRRTISTGLTSWSTTAA